MTTPPNVSAFLESLIAEISAPPVFTPEQQYFQTIGAITACLELGHLDPDTASEYSFRAHEAWVAVPA